MLTQAGPWALIRTATGGALGALGVAADAAGTGAWLREVDPAILDVAGARDRLLDAAREMLQPPDVGLSAVIDLIEVDERWAVVSAGPTGVTLRDLLQATPASLAALDGACVMTLLGDMARACRALHGHGLAHGALADASVAVCDDGAARLLEATLLARAAGSPLDPAADCEAWAVMARAIGHRLNLADDAVEVVDSAASAAESRTGHGDGLGAACDLLLAGSPAVGAPETRRRLATVVAYISGAKTGPVVPTGRDAATLARVPPTARAEMGRSLILGPGPRSAPTGASVPGSLAASAAPLRAMTVVRPEPLITSAPQGVSTAAGPHSRPRRRRRTALIAALIGIGALVGGGAYLLSTRSGSTTPTAQPALKVTGVSLRAPSTVACDSGEVFTGNITTNGGAGELRYRWTRSDGQDVGGVQSFTTLPNQRTYTASLTWNLRGPGSLSGAATLTVIDPAGAQPQTAQFTYDCPG